MNYLAIDLETAGLTPNWQPLEVGMVFWQNITSPVLTFTSRIFPVGGKGHYTIDIDTFWWHRTCNCQPTGAVKLVSEVDDEMESFFHTCNMKIPSTEKFTLVGKNPSFDISFLTRWFPSWNTFKPRCHHRTLDIGTLAFNPLTDTCIPSTEETCKRFGVTPGGHSALEDAIMCRDVVVKYTTTFKGGGA